MELFLVNRLFGVVLFRVIECGHSFYWNSVEVNSDADRPYPGKGQRRP